MNIKIMCWKVRISKSLILFKLEFLIHNEDCSSGGWRNMFELYRDHSEISNRHTQRKYWISHLSDFDIAKNSLKFLSELKKKLHLSLSCSWD